MAKKGRRRISSDYPSRSPTGRDVSTLDLLDPPPSLTRTFTITPPRRLPRWSAATSSGYSPLQSTDDRTWTPDRAFREARTTRRVARLHLTKPRIGIDRDGTVSKRPPILAFKAPEYVSVCVRRQQRREVLHALQKAGKRGQKRPRRGTYTGVHC